MKSLIRLSIWSISWILIPKVIFEFFKLGTLFLQPAKCAAEQKEINLETEASKNENNESQVCSYFYVNQNSMFEYELVRGTIT